MVQQLFKKARCKGESWYKCDRPECSPQIRLYSLIVNISGRNQSISWSLCMEVVTKTSIEGSITDYL